MYEWGTPSLLKKAVIPSDLNQARELEERILSEVQGCGYSEAESFAIKLSLEEALINAIKHGNQYNPEKSVEVAWDVTSLHVEFTITDEGEGFTACCVPDPTEDDNLERPCGRGLMLMQAYMDEVHFNPRGNSLSMRKSRAS
jgi:serine/threonine-protein kinase RsbW